MATIKKIAFRKSVFELLEDRRLLTTYNVAAKFNDNGSADGGEQAFGDDARETAAELGRTFNNNDGLGTVTATDLPTDDSPWWFGELTSGYAEDQAVNSNAPWIGGGTPVPYSFDAGVDPDTFVNYFTYWPEWAGEPILGQGPAADAEAYADEAETGPFGMAYMTGGTFTSVLYNYGNSGLNGDGSGAPTSDGDDGVTTLENTINVWDNVPVGTVVANSSYGPATEQFTAPSTGWYSVAIQLTDPNFDPFDGPNALYEFDGPTWAGDEVGGWNWFIGQPDYLIYDVPAGDESFDGDGLAGPGGSGPPELLASGFYDDIASVNAGETSSRVGSAPNNLSVVGQTYTAANGGLTINAGDDAPDTELPPHPGGGYDYGSGGTWALTNMGPIGVQPDGTQDLTGDQYNMTWTYNNKSIYLNAGDSIQIDTNPRFDAYVDQDGEEVPTQNYDNVASGSLIAPTYVNATISSMGSVAPPALAAGGGTPTYTVGSSPIAVDSGMTLSSQDAIMEGATMTITNEQSGDVLDFANQNGITGSFNSSTGTLTLTGSATPAFYQTALQSVTYSNTAGNPSLTPRTFTVQAEDDDATPTTGNTIDETVDIILPPPTITAGGATANYTIGGAAVKVDPGVTVNSYDTLHITGATMQIMSGTRQSGDTLSFTNQDGITGSYNAAAGTLTLTGTATVADYDAALESVTFSNPTGTSTVTRSLTVSASDSLATPNAGPATTETIVIAPVAVSAAYVSGTAWNSTFRTYLASHTNAVTGAPYGNATYGYALQTGSSSAQLTTLPWFNLNEITVTFTGTVQNIGEGSLKLVGGSGGTAPAVAGFSSLGNNTYQWTLASSLTNNRYVFAIATTGSSFGTAGGTQVVDPNGAGISGTFTTGQDFPSGNGVAATAGNPSTFDFFFNVLPGDVNRDSTDNGVDLSAVRALSFGTRDTSTSYDPYYDVNGDGTISTTDLSLVRPDTGRLASGSPTAPSAAPVGGLSTAIALGVIETVGQSQQASTAASGASIVVAATPTLGGAPPDSDDAADSIGGDAVPPVASVAESPSTSQATDDAVADFDLADLWV